MTLRYLRRSVAVMTTGRPPEDLELRLGRVEEALDSLHVARLAHLEELPSKADLAALEGTITALEERLDGRITALEERINGRMAVLEERINGRMAALEERIDGRIAAVESRIDGRIAAVESRLLRWFMPALVAGFGAVAALVALTD